MTQIFRRVGVIGVLNATPDSFSDGGRFVGATGVDIARGIDLAGEMEQDAGASVIDVGGESTRPGAAEVSVDEECARVVPLIEALAKRFDAPISIDTRKAAVAEAALQAGARVVNDVSGLRHDPALAAVTARFGAELIVGHSRGTPADMQQSPHYDDVIAEVAAELRASVAVVALEAGLLPGRILIDPGLGFGKRPQDNHALLARLDTLAERVGDHGVVVGPSRKAFLGLLTGDAAPDRDTATVAACAIAVFQGADAVRAHDVAGAVRACAVGLALRDARVEAAP